MKLQLLVLCCILQSIYSFNHLIFPPDISSRIVGGEEAPEGLAPYQCSMQMLGQHFCGCAILNSNYILTAAHCVKGNIPFFVRILVGTNDLSKGGKLYKVSKLIPHEHYNIPPFAYDIALVKLAQPIEFNQRASPIEYDDVEVPDGAEVQLTGWGYVRPGSGAPMKLQVIKLNAVQTKRCKKDIEEVHESHICTFKKAGAGACNGDSGGPLVYGKKIVGVVNFGVVPCGSGYPDGFAKVSYFYNWIKEHTK